MATQQDVIKKFMKALDTHTLTKKNKESDVSYSTRIIDAAVKACSNFTDTNSLINKMVADCKSYIAADSKTGWEKFLLEKCGIDLSNDDTGAITGHDVGVSSVSKTNKSIVPEATAVSKWILPKSGSSTTISGLKVNWPTAGANGTSFTEAEKFILKGLNSEWLKQALKLAKTSYGIDFNTSGATVKAINIKFVNDSKNKAQASTTTSDTDLDGKIDILTLTVNMRFYSKIDTKSADGATEDATWLDRTISHELIHAIMGSNVYHYHYIPSFVKEGLAELVHGIDDDNTSGITKLASNANHLKTALSLKDTSAIQISGINNPTYAGGYIFMRYLAKQALVQGVTLSNTTNNKKVTGTELNDTIANNGGANVTISALGGDDSITAYGNKLSINGGAGNNYVYLYADAFNASALTAGGKDSIYSAAQTATINAGAGDDYVMIYKNATKNTVNAGDGKDLIYSGAQVASINAGAGNDYVHLYSQATKTSVRAGAGNDTIQSYSTGVTYFYAAGDGNDSIKGFNADDTISITGAKYSSVKSGSNVILTVGTGKITLVGAASLSKLNVKGTLDGGAKNISNNTAKTKLTGTELNDTIYSNATNVTIDAAGGNDSISNRKSATSISGGAGNDSIYNDGAKVTILGGKGDDSILNLAANSKVDGGTDNDIIYNGKSGNNVTLIGGDGADNIDSRGATVSINAGTGDDSIYVDGSKVTIVGGTGKDSIRNLAASATFIYANGDGNDTIWGFKADSTLSVTGAKYSSVKSGSNVILTVGTGKVTLVGAASLSKLNIKGTLQGGSSTTSTLLTVTNSTKSPVTIAADIKTVDASKRTSAVKITGNAIANTILGGSKNDSLYGAAGNDSILGNAGNDKIYGQDGNDTIRGGAGNDSLWGDAGSDTFLYSNGDGKDVIFGFEDNDLLQITGTFSPSYNKSKDEVYFKVGSTANAITLKNFDATSFNVNGSIYGISGTKLVKK